MVREMDADFQKAAEFHGHICPGLAIGYRVAKYVKEHYPRSEDEELVCIAENNSCSVDAVQDMLGCTFGKGNLIFKDLGKQAFTFYSRQNKKAVRVYFKDLFSQRMGPLRERYFKGQASDAEKRDFERLRDQITQEILTAPEEQILEIKEVDIPAPEKARVYPSIKCQECGESFMEIRGRTAEGKVLCQECYERLTA
jgi:formylmethanofuran dehydrogenase subunit E